MTDNEKIAKFMGLPLNKEEPEFSGDRKMKTVPFQRWKYHESWDWLMPACKKWDDLPLSKFTGAQKKEYGKLCDELDHLISCYELIPAYNHFVKCIDWYETQKV